MNFLETDLNFFKWSRLHSKKRPERASPVHCTDAVWTSPGSPYTNWAQDGLAMSGTHLYESQQLYGCLANSEICGINTTPIHHLHFILEKLQ